VLLPKADQISNSQNKFIKSIIHSLYATGTLFSFMTHLVVIGIWSYKETPIETFPDAPITQILIMRNGGRKRGQVEKL